MMKKISRVLILSWIIAIPLAAAADNGRRVPTIDDLLMLRSAGGAKISPDGTHVAYTVSETDFKQDATSPISGWPTRPRGGASSSPAAKNPARAPTGRPTGNGSPSPAAAERRQKPALPHQPGRRRSRPADECRNGRFRVRMVARRQGDRLRGDRTRRRRRPRTARSSSGITMSCGRNIPTPTSGRSTSPRR